VLHDHCVLKDKLRAFSLLFPFLFFTIYEVLRFALGLGKIVFEEPDGVEGMARFIVFFFFFPGATSPASLFLRFQVCCDLFQRRMIFMGLVSPGFLSLTLDPSFSEVVPLRLHFSEPETKTHSYVMIDLFGLKRTQDLSSTPKGFREEDSSWLTPLFPPCV